MKAFFSFLRSKQFFLHFGLILVFLVAVFFGVIKWLSIFTNHNEYTQVPDFKEVKLDGLKDFINGKDVTFEIIDSIYDPKQKPGIVIRQDPEAGTNVKHNRKVYLYVTGMVPPQVVMPKLVDRSERQARLLLGSYGLKLGKLSEKPSDCNGCVIAQMHKGKVIEKGDMVPKGSSIDLVIGVKGSYYVSSSDTTKTEDVNFDNESNEK
jgi:beta-lactam-binding protein with PASTA domain